MIVKTSEVLEFAETEILDFIIDNKSYSIENQEELIVTNYCLSDKMTVHKRRFIDYEMESDSEEIYILLIIEEY